MTKTLKIEANQLKRGYYKGLWRWQVQSEARGLIVGTTTYGCADDALSAACSAVVKYAEKEGKLCV